MLEVRNLKKIYKTKNGADVNALDGVSLRFPEKGMVFLLGKSGSGKSTLLNVCGGLDSPTDGEIIVKGRSSKSFSQSDFDSYRNTFIGFIFQEYNILNEFSVEDNIALALELQGKPKDKKAIAELLEQVDLSGYAKRKPNTLSGGQKQRIAIARALVKKPEIIMADEPTGALDSNTGKQVFDTLKKLSRDKLVIVVSHDRDFAEHYGDRIIELKDGKVLSDVSKGHAGSEEISANVSRVGDVLCIKKGASLSETEFDSIKKFLQKTESDIVIARDEKSVKTFKTAARITDAGEMEVFRDTDPAGTPQKTYTKEESRFIRSKLPARHAFKIGVSGLRNKPVRLFFTVLLCSVAFVLFGLLSTLNFYDSEATFKQTLMDTEISALQVIKQYEAKVTWYTNGEEDYSYDSIYEARFSQNELNSLAGQLNPNAFGAVRSYSSFNLRQIESQYWQNNITAFATLSESNALRDQITGTYPQADNEIVITSYFADMLYACKVYGQNGTTLELTTAQDIIGKNIVINGREYKVTGILNSGAIPEEYTRLQEDAANDDYTLLRNYMKHLESGLHLLTFVSPEGLEEAARNGGMYYKEGKENYMRIATGTKGAEGFDMSQYADANYLGVSTFPANKKLYTVTKEGTQLGDNEVIVPISYFVRAISNEFSRVAEQANQQENYDLADKYYKLSNMAWELEMGGVYENTDEKTDEKTEPVFKAFSEAEFEAKYNELIKEANQIKADYTIGLQLYNEYNQAPIGEVESYTITSVYRNAREEYSSVWYVSDSNAARLWEEQKVSIPNYPETETNYVEEAGALYTVVYLPGSVDAGSLDTLWNIYNAETFDDNSSRTTLTGGFVESLKTVDYMVKDLSKIFLYVGLVLAVFAALLLSNFISVSISNKKREIGILRAVGARSTDVFKIFFSESFVIGAICVALSAAASILLCSYLNQEMAGEIGASLLVFGVPSLVVLIAIALITILVATFLPVYNAAKKKPVDSIRAL